jgi:hypothetical protein
MKNHVEATETFDLKTFVDATNAKLQTLENRIALLEATVVSLTPVLTSPPAYSSPYQNPFTSPSTVTPMPRMPICGCLSGTACLNAACPHALRVTC